ncbi:hypothetical protein VP01_1424g1 [Puccinia sorghi]|uniref:Uncharacterized protein n=1 Tax=Puccinia sorghi TaxID=27349 RepID=A0A0L6VME0_9BASI|nr:hypothetical protein VP01_1424g1 [Puccinia sorghi]
MHALFQFSTWHNGHLLFVNIDMISWYQFLEIDILLNFEPCIVFNQLNSYYQGSMKRRFSFVSDCLKGGQSSGNLAFHILSNNWFVIFPSFYFHRKLVYTFCHKISMFHLICLVTICFITLGHQFMKFIECFLVRKWALGIFKVMGPCKKKKKKKKKKNCLVCGKMCWNCFTMIQITPKKLSFKNSQLPKAQQKTPIILFCCNTYICLNYPSFHAYKFCFHIEYFQIFLTFTHHFHIKINTYSISSDKYGYNENGNTLGIEENSISILIIPTQIFIDQSQRLIDFQIVFKRNSRVRLKLYHILCLLFHYLDRFRQMTISVINNCIGLQPPWKFLTFFLVYIFWCIITTNFDQKMVKIGASREVETPSTTHLAPLSQANFMCSFFAIRIVNALLVINIKQVQMSCSKIITDKQRTMTTTAQLIPSILIALLLPTNNQRKVTPPKLYRRGRQEIHLEVFLQSFHEKGVMHAIRSC